MKKGEAHIQLCHLRRCVAQSICTVFCGSLFAFFLLSTVCLSLIYNLFFEIWGRRDRMVVGFTNAVAMSAYHH
jgi:hypothetical protein